MKEKKVKNSGISGAPVVLLVLSHVNADFPTGSRCEHVVLLKLESPLTYLKFRYALPQARRVQASRLWNEQATR